MKRIRMLTVLGVLAVILPIGLLQGVAKANGGSGSPNQVTIQPQAQYILAGATIDVGLYVKCQGGSGDVVVNVTQSPPANAVPDGSGLWPADCRVRWADALGRGDRRRVRVRRRDGVGYGGLDNRLPDCGSPCSAVDQHRRGKRIIPRDKAAAG